MFTTCFLVKLKRFNNIRILTTLQASTRILCFELNIVGFYWPHTRRHRFGQIQQPHWSPTCSSLGYLYVDTIKPGLCRVDCLHDIVKHAYEWIPVWIHVKLKLPHGIPIKDRCIARVHVDDIKHRHRFICYHRILAFPRSETTWPSSIDTCLHTKHFNRQCMWRKVWLCRFRMKQHKFHESCASKSSQGEQMTFVIFIRNTPLPFNIVRWNITLILNNTQHACVCGNSKLDSISSTNLTFGMWR